MTTCPHMRGGRTTGTHARHDAQCATFLNFGSGRRQKERCSTRTHTHASIYLSIYLPTYLYIYNYLFIKLYIYICKYMYMYIYIYVNICKYMYICIYVYMFFICLYVPLYTSRARASRVAEVSRFKKCNAIGSKNKFCL